MTTPPLRFVFAWALGALLVSSSSSGAAAGPSGQPPKQLVTQIPTSLLAAPAAPATTAAATTAAAPALTVNESRNALERGLTELGELSMRARQSGDMIRIACVLSKQDRAEAVMEVATADLLTAQDPAADAQTRAFAGEKLSEGALQLRELVAQARACQGRDEASSNGSSNDVRQPQQVLPQDPTGAMPPAQRGFPPIDPRPPVASPVI